jgi:hypothetical protein
MDGNYDLLISKINEFTRKFYLNKLLRGSIYATASITILYLLLFTFVYFTYPGVFIKTVLFFSFILISLAAITFWIFLPLLALLKLTKQLTLSEAAVLIGNHFFTVKDKLMNTLQLKELADQYPGNRQLILASIDQKITTLKPIPFASAIRLNDNRKHLKYILLPFAVIIMIAIVAPAILKIGTYNFVQYNKEILPEAPFDFILLNKNLSLTQGDDLTLNLHLKGNELPQEVYLTEGLNSYKLEKADLSHFTYTLKNLQKNKKIRFSAGGFNSAPFEISVHSRPSILNVSAELHYPAYLSKANQLQENVSDLLIPEGTSISWKIQTENSQKLRFKLNNDINQLLVENGTSLFKAVIRNNASYLIAPQGINGFTSDSLTHQITVIKDQFPTLNVIEKPDSLSSKALYFSGTVTDDHGFSSLHFSYALQEPGKKNQPVFKSISIKKNQAENPFFYFWDLSKIKISPGQSLIYYFEVSDNDGVNGPKTTRSPIHTFNAPNAGQISQKLESGNQTLKNKMSSAIKLASTVEKESKKLGEALLDKKQLTFEDKKDIEKLLKKQKDLEDAVKEIKNQNEKNTFEKNENDLLKEDMKDKQKQIDDLFKNVLDDKTKELLEKLQSLVNENNKDQAQEAISNMQVDNKSLKNELNRILELYKQLEFEQNLKNKTDRLNDLAKEQQDLSKQTAGSKVPTEDLKNKQDKLNKDFQQMKKELNELGKKNEALERPNAFKNPEKEAREIEKQQQDSKDQLDKNNKSKASENQKNAGKQMEQLAQKMKDEQQESSGKENNLNVQELRKLLENLLSSSFDQEKIMLTLKQMRSGDATYTAEVQKQQVIKENMTSIGDSLYSLSKRVPQIESAVNEEMQKINFNIRESLDHLSNRQTAAANRNQQYTMTSINNLALMLNEALSQLQEMMKNAKGGGKGGKQSMQQLQQMQKQLNENMQKAKDQMQQTGNKGTVPKSAGSEAFAKMAQQQQMIRTALQKLNQEGNKDGGNKMGNLNQVIKDMKLTESELVNKRIEQNTINRQKDVLTKLLNAEKAEREQDQDPNRESKAGKDLPPSYRKMVEQFQKQQRSETELLQKLPPGLNYYYKNKVNEYYKLLNSPK